MLLTLLIIAGWMLLPPAQFSQSGRRRPTERPRRESEPETPAPEKTPDTSEENTRLPIPPGGEIEKRDLDPRTATMRFQLKNGLTVLIREKYSKPLVAFTVLVKAGRCDEQKNWEGTADLVQRMLWQGTANRPKTQAAREVRRLGGTIEAETGCDQTRIHLAVPAEKVLEALEIQADILLHPQFEAERVRRQAGLLARERAARNDQPEVEASHSLMNLAFLDESAGTAGDFQEMEALDREKVLDFYRTHYRPGKTIVSIVGAVNPFTLTGPIQSLFGAWPRPDVKPQPTAGAPVRKDAESQSAESKEQMSPAGPQSASSEGSQQTNDEKRTRMRATQGLRYGRLEIDIDPPLLTVGYRLDGIDKSDRPALDVLAAVLGQGHGSRLERELKRMRPVVLEVSQRQIKMIQSELWMYQIWVSPIDFNAAEIGFFEVVQRLRREVISPGELQRAQSLLERRFYDERANLQTEAMVLAQTEATRGDYREADRFVEQVRAVTPAQVQQVASRYLVLSRVTVLEVIPNRLAAQGVTHESFSGWIARQVPGINQPVGSQQVTQALPFPVYPQGERERPADEIDKVIFSLQPEPVRNYSVLRGSRAYVRVDRALPTVSIGVFFHGGRLLEDASNNGITEFMLRMLVRGVKSKWDPETGTVVDRGEEVALTADAIALKLEQYGGEIRIVNEPDFFGFVLNVLSRNQDQALKILADIIERPTFDEAEMRLVRRELTYEMRRKRADPIELAWRALVGPHPYGLSRFGNPEILEKLSVERLLAWRDRGIGRQFPLTIIVGDTDGSLLISTVIAREIRRQETDQTFRAQVPSPPDQPREQVEADGSTPSLAVGFLIPQMKDPQDEVVDLIANFLSGPGGRLSDDLRDESGLAYRVQCTYEQRFLGGAVLTRLDMLPEKENPALEVLERAFNSLGTEVLSDEEFDLGLNAAIATHTLTLQPHPDRVMAYARRAFLNGEPPEVDTYADRVRSVSKEKISAIARQYLVWKRRGMGIIRNR